MKAKVLSFLLFASFLTIIITPKSYSQDSSLYIPRNIKKAYENGTRSYTGAPGKNYWENFAIYNINVELEPQTRVVSGEETIKYKNNSPDSLKMIVFRLYQDIFKKGEARDRDVDASDLTDGVNLKRLVINGDTINLDTKDRTVFRRNTNLYIKLSKAILPNSETNIEAEWSFVMPLKTHMRMGMIDSTSFYVGYWYPQVSVYDDVDGWDYHTYSGQQEFYNNFGNFDVKITVPKNYVVWATGIQQNPGDVFTEKYQNLLTKAKTSDSVVHIITQDDLEKGNITKENEKNTWHFKAEDVTDFAFATSNHFLWDAGSVVVDSKTGRRTLVSAAYRKQAEDFPEVAGIAMKSIKYFSTQIPGVPFPYPKLTVVNGAPGGGMEYPMMVNDYSAPSNRRTVGVTSHEIAHTYFPFYMGTNEQKYAFMDEGWAETLPVEIQHKLGKYDPTEMIATVYSRFAGNESDMPMMVPSTLLNGFSYVVSAYYRPASAYLTLKDMLGKKLFLKALHQYIDEWHGKHPIPYDFFYTFNKVTGQNLDWFWKPWFFEFGAPDVAIKNVTEENGKINIEVEKVGKIPIPVAAKIYYKDGSVDSTYNSAMIWKDGNKTYSIEFNSDKPFNKVEIGNKDIPDVNKKNNIYIKN